LHLITLIFSYRILEEIRMSVDEPSPAATETPETTPAVKDTQPVKEKRSLQATMSVVAWITAVAALGLTVWQSCATQRHNRLSVTPSVSINTSVSRDADFIGMTIANQGLGPGRIKLIRIFVDGQPMAEATKDGWDKAREKLQLKAVDVGYTWTLGHEFVLTAGSSMQFFGLHKNNFTNDGVSQIESALNHIGVAVCYCSFYDECSVATYGNTNPVPCK
jgi:hypothetical protein